MVDVNTQNKTISVNVSSSGVSSNVNASGDTSHYYSEKAREWAISNRIVDGVDYSSKYYANKANESALNAQSFAQSAQNSYNNFQQSVDGALSTVNDTVQIAITTIDTKSGEAIDSINSTKTDIITDIEFVADGEKQEINELADVIKDNANTVNTAIEAGVERLNSIDALKNNQITNCLLEVPQRIKYELTDGTLTIKAGSVVIVPYGVEDLTSQYPVGSVFLHENFKVVDTQYEDGKFFVWAELVGDVVSTEASSKSGEIRSIAIAIQGSTYENSVVANVYTISATVLPDNRKAYQWYQTDTNMCVHVNISHEFTANVISFPIGVYTSSETSFFGSVKQVFNGMGYIGSTIWIDKGVKGLIPNGRNEDGTLKNIEIVTSKIAMVFEESTASGDAYVLLQPDGSIVMRVASSARYYDSHNNYFYVDNAIFTSCIIAIQAHTGTSIQALYPKLPFRAVDYSDASTLGMPSVKYVDLTVGASAAEYIAPANGYFFATGATSATNQQIYMQNVDTKLEVLNKNPNASSNCYCHIPAKRGETVLISYTTKNIKILRFIYAEGDR